MMYLRLHVGARFIASATRLPVTDAGTSLTETTRAECDWLAEERLSGRLRSAPRPCVGSEPTRLAGLLGSCRERGQQPRGGSPSSGVRGRLTVTQRAGSRRGTEVRGGHGDLRRNRTECGSRP